MADFSFSSLMKSAAENIPTKETAPDSKYKFVLKGTKYDSNDNGYRLLLTLQPIQNLLDPSVDVDNYEPVFASWTEKAPKFALEDLASFIASHKGAIPSGVEFVDVLPELVGKTYTGTVSTRNGRQNINNIRLAE